MSLRGGLLHSFTRTGSRSHIAAAAIALILSAGLHATLLSRITSLPILIMPAQVEPKRFAPIEMADVKLSPPEVVEKLETTSLDQPPADIPVESVYN